MTAIIILPGQNQIYVNGVCGTVDCAGISDSAAPSLTIQAVQWNGTTGWIEYMNDPFDPLNFVPNRMISDISQFQSFINAWSSASGTKSPS